MRIGAMAAAYNIPAVPHGSGAYVCHYLITLPYVLFGEYVDISPGGDALVPLFSDMFTAIRCRTVARSDLMIRPASASP